MLRKAFHSAILVMVLIFLLPVTVSFADIAGRSRTLLTNQETIFEENILRLYEYVDLSARDIAGKGIYLHASGWGRYDFDAPEEGDKDNGELSYAYISVPIKSMYSRVFLGRQYIYTGVASEQLDGLYLQTNVSGVGLDLFAGSPPELDIDDRSGDSMYGGRLSHTFPGIYELGASYLKEQNDGDDFREEYGIDVWISPVSWLSVQGVSLYNEETTGWAEHSYRLTIGGPGVIRVFGDYSELDYEHYFQTATTSAFSAIFLTPDESYTASGGGIELLFDSGVQAVGRYKHYSYEIAGDADTYGGGLNYLGSIVSAGVSIDRTDGDTDELKYDMYRGFVSAAGKSLDITLDYILVAYDVEVNGTDQSTAASGTVGYRPIKDLRVGIEGTYSETPQFEKETRGFFKIDYRFGEL